MPSDASGGYEGIRRTRKKKARKRSTSPRDATGGYEGIRRAPTRTARPPRGDVQTGGGYEVGRQAPRPRPQRASQVRDTKSDADRGRAESYKRTADYRKSVRQAYDAASPKERRRILKKSRGREHEIVLKVHRDRMRRRREVQRQRQHEAKDVKSAADLRRARSVVLAPDDPRVERLGRKERSQKLAPVVDVLEETTRPVHAVAGAARAALRGENVPKAALRGVKNKDRYLFSDVLKEAGVPKKVRGPAGFVLDVAADPTTYVTGGVGGAAKKGVQKAATKAAKREAPKAAERAAKRATPKETRRAETRQVGGGPKAPTLSERAATRARRDDPRRGVVVRVVGKEVPGVRRATMKAAAPVRKAGKTRPAQAVKRSAEEVRPTLTPSGVAREEFQEVRRATRTARAQATRGTFKAQQQAVGYKKAIGKKNYEKVIDAIEAGKVRELPENLRKPAKRVQDEFKHARRMQRRAGVKVPERKGYVPHQLSEKGLKEKGVEESAEMTAPNVGRRVIRPKSSKARTEQRTLKELRKEEPGKFSENLPELYARRMDEATTSKARADLNRRVAEVGRVVKKGKDLELRPGEAVFRVRGSDIQKVSDKAELQRLVDQGPKSGQYVVLNEQLVERAMGGVRPQLKGGQIGRAYDVGTGWWKFLATVPNPGFHVRNLLGDTQNAYLAENAVKLARNIGTSGRALKRLHKQEEALRTLGKAPKPTKATVKIQGQKVSLDDLVKEAEKVGAVRTGFIARELPELQTAMKKGAKPAKGVGRRLGRAVQSREDLIRLATYIGGRKRGLSPEKAAERSTKYHFDYADLTGLERNVLRRVAPFYTFSARNIPLQFESFFSKPGKFAQYEKIVEEFEKAFGFKPDFEEKDLSEYEQRSAPIPIKWKGKEFTLSLGPSGLPLTDLNELPTGTKTPEEWMNRAMSMLNPVIKTPVELGYNFSFFFRDQLERDTGPLVPAPSYVARFPKKIRERLGIVPDFVDRRTGKKQWGWPAKLDYVANVLPGPLAFAQRALTPSERPGKGTEAEGEAYVTGVRRRQVEKGTVQINRLYDERDENNKKLARWRQRGVNANRPNKEYSALLKRNREIQGQIEGLKKTRGDKIVRKKTRPRGRPGSGEFGSGGFSGYGSGGFKP